MKKIFIISTLFLSFTITGAFGFETRILPNGQTVIVEQVKNNPIVVIDTWVKTGSVNETDKNTGVSHFLEHLLFKGTKKHPTGEFDRIIESKGGVVNAATSKDFTHFYIQIPSKDFDTALDLHADMLLNPAIPEDELEKERKVVIEEISKDINNPNHKVYNNFINEFYKTHPYKRKVIGNENVISSIPKAEILKYYNKYYIPQNMITIIIGDVEPEYVFKKVQKDFDKPKKLLVKNSNPKEKQITAKKIKTAYEPINSGYLIIGYRVGDIKSADNYALDILAAILGDGRSSVFYKDIIERKQLAFNIDASNSTYKEDGMFLIEANYNPEKSSELKKAIYKELDKIIKNGVTENQLELAKKLIKNETKYSRESVANIASQIGYTTVLADTPKYYENYLNKIEKVTKEDVQCVAKKYLTENKSVVSEVLPENKNITNNETKQIQHSAKFIRESKGIKKYTLDNDATVLINKNTINDIVAISIFAKGGNFLEKIPSTASIMSSTMLKGTKNYTREELAKIMEENGIKISPQASADTFNINVVTTKEQLPLTLELLSDIVNNATFSENDIEKYKKDKLSAIKKSQDTPMLKALDKIRELIYGNTPYSIANNRFLDNYKKIHRNEIFDYYNKIFSAQNLVISINGNVDIDEVKDSFADMFKQSAETYTDKNIIEDNKAPKLSIQKMKDLGTAWIFIGWQVCGVQNTKDYATLTVINSILGSGMSSRLFVNLREKEGLAYQVNSSYGPKLYKGSFMMYIGTNPKTLDKSKGMLLNEIKILKTQPVGDRELQEVKDKIIGRYILSQETNLDKASQAGWFEVSSRGFDFEDKYIQLINNVTKDDIMRVAKKYFTDNNVISIIKEE